MLPPTLENKIELDSEKGSRARTAAQAPGSVAPTRFTAATFLVKSSLLKLRRAAQDIRAGVRRWPSGDRNTYPVLLAESRTPLRAMVDPAERILQQGKTQNLRCAVRALQNIVLPEGEMFSFWKQIGRANLRRGYVAGRQLQEGCIVPAIGGGLCQLSNALYELALQTDCEIVERHAHTRIVPGSAAAKGRDATVYWNYLDLRFRPAQPVLLNAHLTDDTLVVRWYGKHQETREEAQSTSPHSRSSDLPLPIALSLKEQTGKEQASCLSCGVETCFRQRPTASAAPKESDSEPAAYLLDEYSPEFACWMRAARSARSKADILAIPIKGKIWRLPRYAWETEGFAHLTTAPTQTARFALAARRLGEQGAAQRTLQLERAEALANELAKALTPDCEDVCVAQNLLPFLWRSGHLGGRRFTVLLSRQPIAVLQANLDAAALLHPTSPTLRDFRAPDWLSEAETEALQSAERLITPHTYLAGLYPRKTETLSWTLPAAKSGIRGKSIFFPGPTVARKGAYELREAARRLDLEIIVSEKDLEGADFWEGVRVKRLRPGELGIADAAIMVQPAFVEDKPRALLYALAVNIPLIATDRCGLPDHSGVHIVPCGNVDALTAALLQWK